MFRRMADPELVLIDAAASAASLHAAIVGHFVDGPYKRARCAKAYGCDDAYHCVPRLTARCQWYTRRAQILARILDRPRAWQEPAAAVG